MRITWVKVPVKAYDQHGEATVTSNLWPVLLPHDFAEALVNNNFHDLLGHLDPAVLAEYWACWLEAQRLFDHPARGQDARHLLPVQLHGDEGTAHKKQCMILSWQMELSRCKGHALCSRFLIALIPSKYYVKSDGAPTLQSIFSAATFFLPVRL